MRFDLMCTDCNTVYDLAPDRTVCPACAAGQLPHRPLRGVLEVRLTPDGLDSAEGEITSPLSPAEVDIGSFLPVGPAFYPPVPVGNTPLWAPARLREELGFPRLFIKDDGLNPTGSLKDRASWLVAAFARKHGIKEVTAASTGNAGSSMAGIGAAAGLNVTLFLPKTAPRAKMIQSLQYGARLVLVDGNYDRAYDLSLEFTRARGGLNRNTAYNPLTIEGKKTVALEIARQLGRAPEAVFVSVGDGVILAGVYKGFLDLVQMGFIPRVPRIYAVQAEGSDAVRRAFESGDFGEPRTASTVADSISVDVPRNGYLAVRRLRENDGRCVAVSDRAILEAQHFLASRTGLFSEPAGAAAFAGFLAVRKDLPRDAQIVVIATGNGLKDADSAAKSVPFPDRAIKSLEELED
ncbi:MAG: threonine synthase [Acidobacteria bacterium]|nr:threonine synthase [Acidobacteriota bacterium]